MADYQRILSYLYRYEKTAKKECSGFVKAEQKAGNLKLTIQIDDERLLQGMELQLCFYEKQGESWQVWQFDTLITQEHKEEMHLLYPAAVLPADFWIKGQSGVFLYYQDAFYYGSVWIGEEIPSEVLEPLRWHKVANSAKTEPEIEREQSAKVIPLKEGTILEGNNLANVEKLKMEENFQKDFQSEPENEKNNLGSKETLPDTEDKVAAEDEILPEAKNKVAAEDEEILPEVKNKVAAEDEEILPEVKDSMTARTEEVIEESVEIKEVLKEDADIENKSKLEPEEIGSELEAKAESEEIESEKIESGMKKDVETELKLKVKSALELEQKEESSVDNFEKMWINSTKGKPSVDNVFNTAFYEGCRVSAADLTQLGEEAGELRSNQFLLKGYERYHHILAGKVRYAGEKRYCIGVPGIYENREKYMAEIYQFPVFLSLTENRMKTGSFGYWLHLLNEVQ